MVKIFDFESSSEDDDSICYGILLFVFLCRTPLFRV